MLEKILQLSPPQNIFSLSFNLVSSFVVHHKFNMQQINNKNHVKKFIYS
jgi:hypothetical protein